MFINASKNFNLNITWATSFTGRSRPSTPNNQTLYRLIVNVFIPVGSAGTQSGEEIPIISRSNIKEFKDSFSNENFDFRNNPNITFFVYVSNFTWPIKIQVSIAQHLKLPSVPSSSYSGRTRKAAPSHACRERVYSCFFFLYSCVLKKHVLRIKRSFPASLIHDELTKTLAGKANLT